jgi:putative transposase
MPDSCTHVYVHFVWATWNRLPVITSELETAIYACIASNCRELKCEVRAIGGTADHVHSLVRFHSAVSVALLAQGMKGASLHLVNHILDPAASFHWQGTYGAFSVSQNDLEQVAAYVRHQKQHHTSAEIKPDWEWCMEAPLRPPLALCGCGRRETRTAAATGALIGAWCNRDALGTRREAEQVVRWSR